MWESKLESKEQNIIPAVSSISFELKDHLSIRFYTETHHHKP
jgi:hypothetical protein